MIGTPTNIIVQWKYLNRDIRPLLPKQVDVLSQDIAQFCNIEIPLQWRHDERDGISNHRPYDCLPNCLFKRRSRKTWKLSLAFVRRIHRWPVNSPHKGPVTRKMFPFDDAVNWRVKTKQPHWNNGLNYILSITTFSAVHCSHGINNTEMKMK